MVEFAWDWAGNHPPSGDGSYIDLAQSVKLPKSCDSGYEKSCDSGYEKSCDSGYGALLRGAVGGFFGVVFNLDSLLMTFDDIGTGDKQWAGRVFVDDPFQFVRIHRFDFD